ncbi:MAG: hypothetical protein LC749_18010, partial [Actinobacteria bacterium]|nr:hypothetical protein [Actinomycetota bacterium]
LGGLVDELWSDDFEVLHWVVERFERNGHSVEVGEALRVFPQEHYDSVRESLRRLSSHPYLVALSGSGPGRGATPAQDAIEWPRQPSRVPSDLAGREGTGHGLRVLCRRRLAHQPVHWYLRSMAD